MASVAHMAKVTKPKALTPQQLVFVHGVMAGKSQTQAYIDAGYNPKGAQPNSARLISKDMVAAELSRLKAEYAKNAGLTRVMVLELMKEHALAELPDLFDDDGMLLHPKQWPKHMRRLVDKVKIVQNRTGTLVIDSNGSPINVPMYTKEVSLEAKAPILGKLLDAVTGLPDAPATSVTNNVQINVDKAIMDLRALRAA